MGRPYFLEIIRGLRDHQPDVRQSFALKIWRHVFETSPVSNQDEGKPQIFCHLRETQELKQPQTDVCEIYSFVIRKPKGNSEGDCHVHFLFTFFWKYVDCLWTVCGLSTSDNIKNCLTPQNAFDFSCEGHVFETSLVSNQVEEEANVFCYLGEKRELKQTQTVVDEIVMRKPRGNLGVIGLIMAAVFKEITNRQCFLTGIYFFLYLTGVIGLIMAVVDLKITNRKMFSTIIYFFTALTSLTSVSCSLVEMPQNAVAMMQSGDVVFKCKSDDDYKLNWWMQKKDQRQILYDGNSVSKEAESFCRVENEDHGSYHLNITTKDKAAQTYICHEPNTNEEFSADLIIIVHDTQCKTETTDSHVTMTCSVEFRGNWAPELEWSLNGTSIAEGVNMSTVPNKLVSSTLVISPNATGRYTCTTRFDIRGKPEQTTSTNVPDYIHKSILTVEATQGFSDEHDGHSAANGTSMSLLIAQVLVGVLMISAISAVFLFRRQRKKLEMACKPSSIGSFLGVDTEGRPRTMMLDWMFDAKSKSECESLKRKAQDRKEWRHWSMEPVLGQST